MANRQLLRLKQRSNGDILQVAESDDSNNLYVNVAASTPIDISGGTIDEVSKAVLYGTDPDGNEVPLRSNLHGILFTNDHIPHEIIYSTGFNHIDAGTDRYITTDYSVTYDADYRLTEGKINIINFSTSTELSVQYSTATSFLGTPTYTSNFGFTAPRALKQSATSDAWSSCVIYDKGTTTYTDYSSDAGLTTEGYVTFDISEVDDAIYFGAPYKFNALDIKMYTAGDYVATLVWQYWNGSTWVTATPYYDTTSSDGKTLTVDGDIYHSIAAAAPFDWAKNSPDGANMLSQYWVRVICTAFTSKTTSPVISHIRFKPYSAISNVTVDMGQIFRVENYPGILTVSPTTNIPDDEELSYIITIIGG